MLARLDGIQGLEEAQVDHRGELLRVAVAEAGVIAVVSTELSALGYQAEPLSELNAADVRWYAFDDVRNLSREEAEIISRRVTPAFRRSRALSDSDAIRLEHAVADALYSCFASDDLGSGVATGALLGACLHAAEDAARPVVGVDAARDYAALLADDLKANRADARETL